MADGNVFIFSPPDLLTSCFSVFHDMQKKGELSDVTIRIDNRVFSAHRIILAGAIPYFHAMFTSNLLETQEKVITMKELDPTALEDLINFAYTSEVEITTENVQSLFVASDFLQLIQVRDACYDFLTKTLHPSNVMNVREFADSLNCGTLVENCDLYLRQNFDDFCKAKEFLSLTFNFLQELIRRDDLHVKSEENVFDAVMTWVNSDTQRHNLLPELLTGVRMTLLSPRFLINKVSREELISQSLLCRNLLDEVKHYHMLPEEPPSCRSLSLSERCCGEQVGMYLFCCNTSTGLTVMKYTSCTGKWNVVLNDMTRFDVLHVVALNDQIHVFRRKNVFEMFNPRTLKWTSRMNFPGTHDLFRYAVAFGNKIFCLAHGESARNAVVFDSEENEWADQFQNTWRIDHGELLPFGKVIYALNCKNDEYYSYVRKNKIYDPQNETTNEIGAMIEPRSGFGSAVLDGKIYVCGGEMVKTGKNKHLCFCERILASTEVLNPPFGPWSSVSPMNIAKKNLSLVAYNKKLYAVGGKISNGIINIVECYDPAVDKWTVDCILSGEYYFVKPVVVSEAEKD